MKRTPAELEQMQRIRDVRARIAANAFCKPVAPPTPAPAIIPPVRKPVREQTRAQRLARCVRLISHIYGVPREEIRRGKSRKRDALKARAAYTWMLWIMTDWGLIKIGRHQESYYTTIMHSLRKLSKIRSHRRSYQQRRAPGVMWRERWTDDELSEMTRLFVSGSTDEQIAAALGRPLHGVKSRRLKDGLYLKKPHTPAIIKAGKFITRPQAIPAAYQGFGG